MSAVRGGQEGEGGHGGGSFAGAGQGSHGGRDQTKNQCTIERLSHV